MKRFPSPIGELHFSMTFAVHWDCYRMVSVPYRGATFLNNVKPTAWELVNKFPSPIGELHFSMGNKIISTSLWNTVSVPYRGATFLNSTVSSRSVDSSAVSVPYRGATFLNTREEWYIDYNKLVSVPYRGATFLNHNCSVHEMRKGRFPSPIGELHFSIHQGRPLQVFYE